MSKDYTDWHRLFGLLLMDFFSGSPFQVEMEIDLSLKKQLLDLVIIRKGRARSAPVCRTGWGSWRPTT